MADYTLEPIEDYTLEPIEAPQDEYKMWSEDPMMQTDGVPRAEGASFPKIVGGLAAGAIAFPVAGLGGATEYITSGGDLGKAQKVMEDISSVPSYFLSEEEKKIVGESGELLAKPFTLPGEAAEWAVKQTPLRGTVAEPIARTLGEAAAFFALPGYRGLKARASMKGMERPLELYEEVPTRRTIPEAPTAEYKLEPIREVEPKVVEKPKTYTEETLPPWAGTKKTGLEPSPHAELMAMSNEDFAAAIKAGEAADRRITQTAEGAKLARRAGEKAKQKQVSFKELSVKSDEIQKLIDAKHDEFDKQGISWKEQNENPELTALYNERIKYDTEAATLGYRNAKQIIENELKGYPKTSPYASVNSILREHYSLTEKPPGTYTMSEYTGKALDNPQTIKNVAKDITKLLFEKDFPNADFWITMESPMSGLTRKGKEVYIKRGIEKAERIHEAIRESFIEKPVPPDVLKEYGLGEKAKQPWEMSTRAVDVNGTPITVYRKSDIASDFGAKEGKPIFFGSDKGMVNTFGNKTGKTYEAKLDIKNPYYADWNEIEYLNENPREMAKLKAQGYDGIIEKSSDQDSWQYVVFDKSQIKSVTGDSTAWGGGQSSSPLPPDVLKEYGIEKKPSYAQEMRDLYNELIAANAPETAFMRIYRGSGEKMRNLPRKGETWRQRADRVISMLEKREADKKHGVGEKAKSEFISPETLESIVKGGRIGDLPKYAKGSSINLERMNTTQDVLQFQNILTQAAEKEIGKQKISWDETVKAAQDLGWDEKEFLKASKRKGGFSAAEIHAMRQINANGLHDLFKTIQDMPADRALRTDEMRSGIVDKITNYVEIMKSTSQKSSEAGRALNIHKKMIEDNPEFIGDAYRRKVLKKMMDDLGGKEMTDQMIDDLKHVDFSNPKEVRDIIQKYHKAGWFDMIYEGWMNGLLSAPTTHAANILGNTLTIATKIPETAVMGVLRGKIPVGEVKSEFVGMWQGMKDGVRSATKAFIDGVSPDMATKIESKRLNAIPGKTGEVVRVPTKALMAADEFFKSITYRMELNRLAYSMANVEGLKGEAMSRRMAKIMNNPQDPAFVEVHKKAHFESLYRTFNNPLGKWGNSIMAMRDTTPGIRYIVPFIRTPINIAKFALERTPLNFVKLMHDYKTGKISEGMVQAELAKPIVGCMISAVSVMLAQEGMITGGAPRDKRDRELFYLSGKQPYSIKVGNTWYSYSRLEPIGSILGMTADFADAVMTDKELNERASQIMLSFTKNIASKTFLQGFSAIMDAISDPERYGSDWIEKTAGSIVPSVIAAGARSIDPYIKDVTNPIEAMQQRIPFLSKEVAPKVDEFGLPLERPGSPISRFLSPVLGSEERPGFKEYSEAEMISRKFNRVITREQKKILREMQKTIRRSLQQ